MHQPKPKRLGISLQNANHNAWGNACDAWWLKDTGNFSVISERMPAYTSEIRHYHEHTEQFFYCLSGLLTIEMDACIYHLSPHEGCTVLPGQIHHVRNDSDLETTFLVISSLNARDDRVEIG